MIARNRSLGALDHQRRDLHSIKLSYLTEDQAASTITRPSEETVHASVKLPEQGIGLCLAGEASPRSPDLTRPPVNVDRVSLCPIFNSLRI